MSPLDRAIIDLCERHNLLSASVDCHRGKTRNWFSANVQWRDETKEHGRDIAASSGTTFADALNGAVAAMLAQRGAADIPDDLELDA